MEKDPQLSYATESLKEELMNNESDQMGKFGIMDVLNRLEDVANTSITRLHFCYKKGLCLREMPIIAGLLWFYNNFCTKHIVCLLV